jgi:hypothetical protein
MVQALLTMENEPELIQSQGGKARAEKLSAERKSQIALMGAWARWGGQAIKKGNFQKEFGIDVDCYVLNDATKTAVVSQRGIGRALGMSSSSGNEMPRFLATKAMAGPAGDEIRDKISQPIKFQWVSPGGEQPPSLVYGFDVTLLIDICRLIIVAESEGKFTQRQKGITSQAHIILNASAKSGIKGLVYALAGYDPTAEEVIQAFKTYVQEEAKKYAQEFPTELYAAWQRLYEIPAQPRGRSWHFKHLTVNHVYYPLAQSNGKILELVRASKAKGGDRDKKLFQFLSEIGARALRIQLGRILEMSESSANKTEYERKITQRFGGQQEFELVIPEPPAA